MALVARIELRDPFGNRKLLMVNEMENHALGARLRSIDGTPLALLNLQLREPLPAFWGEDRSATLREVERVVLTGVCTIERVEISQRYEEVNDVE